MKKIFEQYEKKVEYFLGNAHALRPSGMSRYGFSPQDTDFTSSYPGPSVMNPRGGRGGGYNDFSGGGSAMGSMCNMAPAHSTNSVNSGGCGGDGGDTQGQCNGTNLIVNYLPQDMGYRELYALFRTCGPMNTCRIMKQNKTGNSLGYAFVDFVSEIDAQNAIKSLNGVTVRNKRIKVSYARPGGESVKDTNLYVTNLPSNITDDELEKIFGKYGNIVQKIILRDKVTGNPRGAAFVRFSNREEAQEAISALNNVIPEGASQPLTVRLAEERGKQKANHFMNQSGMGPPAAPVPAAGPGHNNNNMVHRGRHNKIHNQKVHPYHNPQKFI